MNFFAKFVGFFIKTAVDVTKGITGSIKDVSDLRKNELDIRLRKRELADKESPIKIATFDEIKEFDPKIKKIEDGHGELDSGNYRLGRSAISSAIVSTITRLLFAIAAFWGIWQLLVFIGKHIFH